jgi:hypothetical protein
VYSQRHWLLEALNNYDEGDMRHMWVAMSAIADVALAAPEPPCSRRQTWRYSDMSCLLQAYLLAENTSISHDAHIRMLTAIAHVAPLWSPDESLPDTPGDPDMEDLLSEILIGIIMNPSAAADILALALRVLSQLALQGEDLHWTDLIHRLLDPCIASHIAHRDSKVRCACLAVLQSLVESIGPDVVLMRHCDGTRSMAAAVAQLCVCRLHDRSVAVTQAAHRLKATLSSLPLSDDDCMGLVQA